MHPKSQVRRVHSAQLKAAVLAACNEPGASIAAVALANGLNTHLVRKWRMGRGLRRAGLSPLPAAETTSTAAACTRPSARPSPSLVTNARFLPIEMAAPPTPPTPPALPVGATSTGAAAQPEPSLHIEFKRGPVSLTVRWPVAAARHCTARLRELTGGLMK
jgi:transposase